MSSSRSFRSLHLDSLVVPTFQTVQQIRKYKIQNTQNIKHVCYTIWCIIMHIYIRAGCAIIHLCVSFQVIQISHPFRQACKCCGHVLEHRTRGWWHLGRIGWRPSERANKKMLAMSILTSGCGRDGPILEPFVDAYSLGDWWFQICQPFSNLTSIFLNCRWIHDHHHHHLVGWSGSRIQSHCPLWCPMFA